MVFDDFYPVECKKCHRFVLGNFGVLRGRFCECEKEGRWVGFKELK